MITIIVVPRAINTQETDEFFKSLTYSHSGENPYEIIYEKLVPDFEYKVMPLKSLKLDRTNLILSVRKLENTGFKVRKIKDILEECVEQYVKH